MPGNVIRHRASLYADDLVVFVAPVAEDLHCLREILSFFAGASGLVTNVDKCVASPIRCSDELMLQVQLAFPCVVSPFPCRYLGIPLSLLRLKRVDEQALVDRVAARIPTWKAGLLTQAGRATLTKVTLSAIPIHISIACCLSAWAVGQIDKRRRAFLWAGTSTVSGGRRKVAWTKVCRPTCFDGLGILDLHFFGFALRLRWEWLSRAAPDSCWATLPSRPEKAVTAMAAVSMSVILGDRGSAMLWTDCWSQAGPLCRLAPDLFAAISCAGKKRTVTIGLATSSVRLRHRFYAST